MNVLVGKKAPSFQAKAVVNGEDIVEDFSLDQFKGDKYVVFFFYPKDFTFVCPTELHAFQEHADEFEELDTQLVACSTDTEESHWAWLQTEKDDGGINGVEFPIVADTNKTIARNYGVLAGDYKMDNGTLEADSPELVAYRGLFLIDKEGVVRHQVVNDMPLGRNVKETLRMVKALQHHEEKGEVCPANWEEGEETFKEDHNEIAEYLSKH